MRESALGLGFASMVLLGACVLDRNGQREDMQLAAGGTNAQAGNGGQIAPAVTSGPGGNVGGGGQGGVATGGDPTGGAGGGGGAGGSGGGVLTCPNALGPTMVAIAHPGGNYCVDATEVTSKQYEEFINANATPQLPPKCSWKTDHVPRSTGNACSPKHYDPDTLPNRPVACVDWCDAYAYCAWAGKRMCGAVGGGPAPFNSSANADTNEWFNACSQGDTLQYPYGASYEATTCVGDDFDGVSGDGSSDDAEDVTSAQGCVGGYPGLNDLSGNVWEWEQSCNTMGATDQDNRCHARGGSFWDPSGDLTCDSAGPSSFTRSFYNKNVGFRCCADTN